MDAERDGGGPARGRVRLGIALVLGAAAAQLLVACGGPPAPGPPGGRAWELAITETALLPEIEWEGQPQRTEKGLWGVVYVTIRQAEGQSGPPRPADFELQDRLGNRYAPSEAPAALGFAKAKGLTPIETLPAPGEQLRTVLVFEVPADIQEPRLALRPGSAQP